MCLTLRGKLAVVLNDMSPRPNVGRVFVGVRLLPSGHAEIERIATEYGTTVSEVIRRAIKHGLPAAERELRKESI